MPVINVTVKWSGKKFENLELGKVAHIVNLIRSQVLLKLTVRIINIDTDESPELFKTQIYSQTGVPPERQKIMVKGGILKVSSSKMSSLFFSLSLTKAVSTIGYYGSQQVGFERGRIYYAKHSVE